MKDVQGKVAVITGGSRGIGRAIALRLAREGCRTALIARGRDKLKETAAEIHALGGRAEIFPCDLMNPKRVAATLKAVEKKLGPIDILVNNAGVGTFKPITRTSFEEAMAPVQLPFGAAVAACHAVIPSMIARGSGHIVNLNSPAGYFALAYVMPYAASRHAMVGLSLCLREELNHQGVGVSLITPGEVHTDYFQANDADMNWFPRIAKLFPVSTPEQVAERTLRAIQKNQREVIFPFIVKFMVRYYQRFPRSTTLLLRMLGLWQPSARP